MHYDNYNLHCVFLSTLSLRRATDVIAEMTEAQSISIHALLAESDHGQEANSHREQQISIHALLAESDVCSSSVCTSSTGISIHALLAESDIRHNKEKPRQTNFYPRSPCGERLMHALKLANAMLFLSTLSLRRATINRRPNHIKWNISIHALLAESDKDSLTDDVSTGGFLSTLSLRRATNPSKLAKTSWTISIHALLAESDFTFILPLVLISLFLSTLSLRRATADP